MATWTNIPDTVLEPGKPARAVDALALRDNAIAIAEGAAGAPRIQTNAINNSAVTNEKINSVAWGKVTGRPAVTATYVGSEYALTTTAGGTFLDYRLPANYVVTGIRGNNPSGGSTVNNVQTLFARQLRVVL